MIIGVDINDAQEGLGRALRHDALRQPEGGRTGRSASPHLVNMTKRGADQIGGADYTFDCTGNVDVMRDGAREQPSRLGPVDRHRRRRRRPGDQDAAVPARHRARLEGHRVRRRARAHGRAADRRLVHGRQDRDRPDDHPHAAARAHQRRLRPDAQGREHPQRGGVLSGFRA